MSLVIPSTPLAPLATAGDGLVTIEWSPGVLNPNAHRAVVGYILTPYIGIEAQAPLDFAADVTMPITLTQDGNGVDLVNGTTYTFRVAAISSVGLGLASPASVAVTPNPAAQVALTTEPWDYSTSRIQFTLTQKMRTDLDASALNGHTPLITVTRSGYGAPTTPLDGVKLFEMPVREALILPYQYHVNDTIPSDDPWVRPPSLNASIYDHNLQPGRWYYYTLFLKTQPDAYLSHRGDNSPSGWVFKNRV